MAKPSKANVTGVESYDHGRLKMLPEYHKARKALDDLVHAINEREATDGEDTYELGQAGWLKVVEQMAASLPYADSSGHKPRANCAYSESYDPFWPYRTVVENGRLQGWYRCPGCGMEWGCWYSINAPEWF